MNNIALSQEDLKRIKDSEFYEHAKRIMRSHEFYINVNVGEVYSVSYLNSENKSIYISSGRVKDKFMIIHKDAGFVFGKKIRSDGTLGKHVICLTIRFPAPSYSLELDSAQAEAIIFQSEDAYDPFREGKDLSKKKNKARRLNKLKVVVKNTVEEAVKFVSSLNVGDILYDAETTFGSGIISWRVKSIDRRPVDKSPQKDWSGKTYAYGATSIDQDHNTYCLDDVIKITLEIFGEVPSSRRWVSKNRELCFTDFLDNKKRYRDWYVHKPITVEEV